LPTEACNAPNVAGLIYIAAFIPDQGQSAFDPLTQAPPANKDMRATKDDSCSPPATRSTFPSQMKWRV
jgi:hypothetical protein